MASSPISSTPNQQNNNMLLLFGVVDSGLLAIYMYLRRLASHRSQPVLQCWPLQAIRPRDLLSFGFWVEPKLKVTWPYAPSGWYWTKAVSIHKACDWKKICSLLPTSKKLTFPILPRKKWLTLLEAHISAFFEVRDHKRLVLNTIICCLLWFL